MTLPPSFNFSEICGELPNGAALASGEYQGSLTIEVTAILSLGSGMRWGLRISKPRATPSGRRGKPEHVATIVANDGQTIPDMLHTLAAAWEQGEAPVTSSEEN